MQVFLAKITPLFADTPTDALGLPVGASGAGHIFRAVDILVVIAAILLVMTALICWAIFIRKPTNEHARTRVYKSHSDTEEREDGTVRKRKRHKTQRRAHRARNPTLAEAGGLPPVRPSDSPRSDL